MSTWRSQLRCRARRGKSSGVPQFDEFALWNFGQQSLNEDVKIGILNYIAISFEYPLFRGLLKSLRIIFSFRK